jgi:hypothetical protein
VGAAKAARSGSNRRRKHDLPTVAIVRRTQTESRPADKEIAALLSPDRHPVTGQTISRNAIGLFEDKMFKLT